jgi:hypothetical protein
MEGEQGAAAASSTTAAEPEADGAVSDSFSQLWTDVMGMLVSSRTVGLITDNLSPSSL